MDLYSIASHNGPGRNPDDSEVIFSPGYGCLVWATGSYNVTNVAYFTSREEAEACVGTHVGQYQTREHENGNLSIQKWDSDFVRGYAKPAFFFDKGRRVAFV